MAAITGEAGQVTAAGTPMVTIVRSGEREIQINVPENVKLSVGQQAEISFWALPDVTAKALSAKFRLLPTALHVPIRCALLCRSCLQQPSSA